MIHIENTWVQKKVVPNLNIQILYMDKAYMERGEVAILVSDENKPQTIQPIFYYDSEGLVCFNLESPSFYFNHSLTPIPYAHTQEFTNQFKQASSISAFYIPEGTFGAIIKIK